VVRVHNSDPQARRSVYLLAPDRRRPMGVSHGFARRTRLRWRCTLRAAADRAPSSSAPRPAGGHWWCGAEADSYEFATRPARSLAICHSARTPTSGDHLGTNGRPDASRVADAVFWMSRYVERAVAQPAWLRHAAPGARRAPDA